MAVAAGVSLVMCVAVCVLWVRSLERGDGVGWSMMTVEPGQWERAGTIWLYSGSGSILLGKWVEHHSQPLPLEMHPGFTRATDSPPVSPNNFPLHLGWRHAWGGFGSMHDWQAPPQPNQSGFPALNLLQYFWIESSRALWVPHWLVALLFALLPARWIYTWRKGRMNRGRGFAVEREKSGVGRGVTSW